MSKPIFLSRTPENQVGWWCGHGANEEQGSRFLVRVGVRRWHGMTAVHTKNDVLRLHSSSRIEIKFVDFTRFETTVWSRFGDQVARKPRPQALKRRVSGGK